MSGRTKRHTLAGEHGAEGDRVQPARPDLGWTAGEAVATSVDARAMADAAVTA